MVLTRLPTRHQAALLVRDSVQTGTSESWQARFATRGETAPCHDTREKWINGERRHPDFRKLREATFNRRLRDATPNLKSSGLIGQGG
jgi:hypothetical protein